MTYEHAIVPDIGQLNCQWADAWDAHAMIGRAEAISEALRNRDGEHIFGHGTTILDMNGNPRHSSFGTRYVLGDGGSVGVSLGLSKEARATTDDLTVNLWPADGPRLAISLRIPARYDAPRPGMAEISAVAEGLGRLGRNLSPGAKRMETTASRQIAMTTAVATLLAHRTNGTSMRKVRIISSLDGAPVSIQIMSDTQTQLRRLDAVSEMIILDAIPPAGTLHLETHGAGMGKSYRSHALKTVVDIPERAPDPMTTMRMIGELGLPDIPDYAEERR